jgi:hypothetical protein
LLEADLEVDAVGPQVHVVDVLQRPLAELRGVVLPLLGEPGDRGRRQAMTGTQELLNAREKLL